MLYAHIASEAKGGEKRRQTCEEHARSVAFLAQRILAPLGLPETGKLAGLLHDMGKCTEEFNSYLIKASEGKPVRRGSVIHTFAGVGMLMRKYHSRNQTDYDALVSEILAVSIGSHHGLIDLWDERHRNGFEHRMIHQQEYDERAASAFYRECADEAEVETLFGQAVREIESFCQQRIVEYAETNEEMMFASGLLARLITSAVVDADRTDTRCFMQNSALPERSLPVWDGCAAHINAYVTSFPQETPIQRARGVFSSCCAEAAGNQPGLYRLDLPTGGGKTLAALRFAVLHAQRHQMQRIFYAAPLLSMI